MIRRATLFVSLCSLAGFVSAEGRVQVGLSGNVLVAQAAEDVAGAQVRVTGPGGFVLERSFAAGEAVALSLADRDGASLQDGQYNFEVVWSPRATAQRGAAEAAGSEATAAGPRAAGTFRVNAGQAALPSAVAEPQRGGRRQAAGSDQPVPPVPDDQVIPDDLIVQGSTCVGLDCVNNENFGFDTIRLKENNTRLQFDDTSSSAGFSTNNWQVRANDSASGGRSFLGFVDQGAAGSSEDGNVVLSVTAGAPTDSIRVDSTGRVGLRTATPVLDLHIATSNTPAIRLEQNNSGGFTAQTWDIAGNEANFFVRDVTGGSRLPLRIRPGAPTSSIDINASGLVGVGTASPSKALHVVRSDGNAQVKVDDTSAAAALRTLLALTNNGAVRFTLSNTATGTTWANDLDAANNYTFNNIGNVGVEATLTPTGGLTILGALTQGSDRNAKDDIIAVDPAAVLAKVSELEIATWRYKGDPSTHVGPMAQDFRAAFGLGPDDTHIAPGDMAGLSLAAIQALQAEVALKDARIQALEERLARIEAALQK